MSVKPEFTLSCLKESKKYWGAECPIGTFVVRLYWSDYSKYVKSEKKLDGVHLLYDNKKNFQRICEFAITSLESLEYLVANCSQASGVKGKWFQKQTAYALMKFRGFARTAYKFMRPVKVAIQAATTVVSDAVESGKEAIKKAFRRPFQYQPQSFAQCTTLEQAVYLFSRCPEEQMKLGFIDNFYSTLARVSPKTNLFGDIWDEIQEATPTTTEALADDFKPCYDNKSGDLIGWIPGDLDSIAPALVENVPGEVQIQSLQVQEEVVEVTENEYRKLLRPVLDFKKPHAFLKEIGFKTGTVIGGHPRASKDLFEKVVKNCWKNQVSVSQLRDIIAAGN